MTLLALLTLTACQSPSPAWRVDAPRIALAETTLDFGAVGLDQSVTVPVVLENRGGAAGVVTFVLDEPRLQLDRSTVEVPALAEAAVDLRFTPTDAAPVQATLVLLLPDPLEPLELAITGATNADGDADGALHPRLGGDDCDDTDPTVYPGASETWYDDVDADCDGASDFDADGDAFEAAPRGEDCDDSDHTVFPGAAEVWYDGVDADCDGASDFDADADGYEASPRGDDCDDADPRANPGRAEVWYDGVDADCDGASDFDADGDGADRLPQGDDCDDADARRGPSELERTDGEDQDCDGLIDEHLLRSGSAVLTEVLSQPTADPDDEYVEIYNPGPDTLHLDHWTLRASGGLVELPAGTALEPGDWLVLCRTGVRQMNAWCDLSWDEAFSLGNTEDTLSLEAGSLLLDELHWDASWAWTAGVAQSAITTDAVVNDDAASWCAETQAAGADLGSPGAAAGCR